MERWPSSKGNFADDQANIDSSRYIVRGSYGSMGVAGLANRAASASRLIRRDPSRPWPLSWWRKELQQALQLQALQLLSRRRQVLLPQPLLGSPLLLSSLQLAGSRLHRRRSGLVLPVASD